jgi:YidC/Oxa1 family membrane protein insertase
MKKTPNQESIILLVFLGILSSFALFAWWQWYQKPLIKYEQYQRQQAAAMQQDAGKSSNDNQKQTNTIQVDNKVDNNFNTSQDNMQSFIGSINFNDSLLDRQEAINQTPESRVEFETSFVKGSINPKGLLIDDLTLTSYKQDVADGKGGVAILSPIGFKNRGMIFYTLASDNQNITMPNLDTRWSLVKNVSLNEGALDLEFAWINPQGVKFIANIVTPDETNPYKFTVFYSIENNSGQNFNITTKGIILKTVEESELSQTNVATGFAGYADDKLQEHAFKDLKKTNQKTLCTADVKNKETGLKDSWLGLTEKYWFNGFFSSGKVTCINFEKANQDPSGKTFMASFVSEPAKIITGAESTAYSGELFAGAKKIDIISSVSYKKYQLFDRIIDFGFLYILTKPLLLALNLCNKITHNYGLSIILLTILLKFALYPLGKKSFKSISKIKKITPMIEELKKRHKDNRKALQSDIASLYKNTGYKPSSRLPANIAANSIFYCPLQGFVYIN